MPTTVVDWLRAKVSRELSIEEISFLSQLSVQGIAKVNSDQAKGVDVEQTLADLRLVYRAMKRRREAVVLAMPFLVQPLLFPNTKGRSEGEGEASAPTTDEIVFLSECARSGFIRTLLNDKGQLLEAFDLENSALSFRETQLTVYLHTVSISTGKRVIPCQLAATECPADLSALFLTRPRTMLTVGDGAVDNCVQLSLSPIVTWFRERYEGPLQVSCGNAFGQTCSTRKSSATSPASLSHYELRSNFAKSISVTIPSGDDEGGSVTGEEESPVGAGSVLAIRNPSIHRNSISQSVSARRKVRFAENLCLYRNRGDHGSQHHNGAFLMRCLNAIRESIHTKPAKQPVLHGKARQCQL